MKPGWVSGRGWANGVLLASLASCLAQQTCPDGRCSERTAAPPIWSQTVVRLQTREGHYLEAGPDGRILRSEKRHSAKQMLIVEKESAGFIHHGETVREHA